MKMNLIMTSLLVMSWRRIWSWQALRQALASNSIMYTCQGGRACWVNEEHLGRSSGSFEAQRQRSVLEGGNEDFCVHKPRSPPAPSEPSILLNLALWQKTTILLCMQSLQGPHLWLVPYKIYSLPVQHITASGPGTVNPWRAAMQCLSWEEKSTKELPWWKCVHRIQENL